MHAALGQPETANLHFYWPNFWGPRFLARRRHADDMRSSDQTQSLLPQTPEHTKKEPYAKVFRKTKLQNTFFEYSVQFPHVKKVEKIRSTAAAKCANMHPAYGTSCMRASCKHALTTRINMSFSPRVHAHEYWATPTHANHNTLHTSTLLGHNGTCVRTHEYTQTQRQKFSAWIQASGRRTFAGEIPEPLQVHLILPHLRSSGGALAECVMTSNEDVVQIKVHILRSASPGTGSEIGTGPLNLTHASVIHSISSS